MKYNNTNYLQLTRKLFDSKYSTLSINAKWLFVNTSGKKSKLYYTAYRILK